MGLPLPAPEPRIAMRSVLAAKFELLCKHGMRSGSLTGTVDHVELEDAAKGMGAGTRCAIDTGTPAQ